MDIVAEKTCSRCRETKAASEFGQDTRHKDGLKSACQTCVRAARGPRLPNTPEQLAQKRAYNAAHRVERNAKQGEWRAANRDARKRYEAANAETIREYGRQYRLANRPRLIELTKRWARTHPEKRAAWRDLHRARINAKNREWAKQNPEKIASKNHERRVRLRGATAERVLLSVLIERDKGRCQICGKPKNGNQWSIDHIRPVSKGGAHTYANTQLAHRRCNSRRGNKGSAQLRLLG